MYIECNGLRMKGAGCDTKLWQGLCIFFLGSLKNFEEGDSSDGLPCAEQATHLEWELQYFLLPHAAETAVSATGCPLLRTIKYNFTLVGGNVAI